MEAPHLSQAVPQRRSSPRVLSSRPRILRSRRGARAKPQLSKRAHRHSKRWERFESYPAPEHKVVRGPSGGKVQRKQMAERQAEELL
eukprot:2544255-Rhodomonas_salina.1